jgi:hypothetical protein
MGCVARDLIRADSRVTRDDLKAAERRRTPKRKRVLQPYNLGHVLECGAVAPLLN